MLGINGEETSAGFLAVLESIMNISKRWEKKEAFSQKEWKKGPKVTTNMACMLDNKEATPDFHVLLV